MFKVMSELADCELRSVIRFLNAKYVKPAKIHSKLVDVW